MSRHVAGALLFVAFGLCVEIAFTGVLAGRPWKGEVSLLMVPVYATAFALIGPFLGLLRRLRIDRPLWRIPLGVLVVYAVEWSFGAFYASLGLHPWHYHHGWASDFSGGHITLLYAPAWAVFVALVVPVHRAILRAAPSLARLGG